MDFIKRLTPLHTDVWIGGQRSCHKCSTWKWISVGVIKYFNWRVLHGREGEPNNAGSDEDCIEASIGAGDGKWNDESCGDKREFVCKSVWIFCNPMEYKTQWKGSYNVQCIPTIRTLSINTNTRIWKIYALKYLWLLFYKITIKNKVS